MKEKIMVTENILWDTSCRSLLREMLEGPIASKTAAPEPLTHGEPELTGDLFQLIPHLIVVDEEDLTEPTPQQEPRIPSEEDPSLAPRERYEATIRCIPEIEGVVPHDPEPFGQPAQHAIRDEAQFLLAHDYNLLTPHDHITLPRT
jgi:hypothetical protein